MELVEADQLRIPHQRGQPRLERSGRGNPLADEELHRRLTGCLFSHEHAGRLFTALGAADPDQAAADFIAVLEGLVFDRFAGRRNSMPAGTPDSTARLTGVLRAQLRSVAASAARSDPPIGGYRNENPLGSTEIDARLHRGFDL
ncbi:hypothetical protein NDR87_05670 [Nocardia sp. CDC159]|uniref:Tetracyclin repressor-like C-terminal group 31 domain-containing protein n=1 Tax=Nocardia pulmonis TaxID=2951408 RepID=A0A9X2IUG6_9NOCA|nr:MULTISPECIES: hypothetical protein [Nocardia]MCM6772852.1 hypothetical protein [Nocardia pulmonis]MCM6785845.1 hypothetical protein [Nocardia sp. CDC159]